MKNSNLNSVLLLEEYPYSINLYEEPPEFELIIDKFKEFAIRRINILNTISSYKYKNQINVYHNKEILQCINDNLPLLSNYIVEEGQYYNDKKYIFNSESIQNIISQRKIDHASHYILLLLCCDNQQMKNWLIRIELILFRIRLMELNKKEKKEFIRYLNLNLEYANPQEYNKYASYYNNPEFIYKVEFEKVTELVKKRNVIINKGYAFVPSYEVDHIICYNFESNISKNLDLMIKIKNFRINDFEYIYSILDDLKDKCEYDTEKWRKNSLNMIKIKHNEIEQYSKYFPPCMNFLFKKLKQNHHLKYGGRMQFGLFLKCGVGLSVVESLLFWKESFFPLIDELTFDKSYAYNIRHNYGLEGSRIDYNSFNCYQIQNNYEPRNFDHYHGCPFKHFSHANLIHFLNDYIKEYDENSPKQSSSINNTIPQPVFEMINIVNKKEYNRACSYLYYYIHSNNKENFTFDIEKNKVLDHPDKFFINNINHFYRK